MEIAKGVLVCLLLSGAGAANAADRGFYFGVLGGQADYEFERPRLIVGTSPVPPVIGVVPGPIFRPDPPPFPFPPPAFGVATSIFISPSAWPAGADSEAGAWGAIAGYRIFRYAAVELNYLNLGTLKRGQTVFVGLPPTANTAEVSRELETTGPAASALGILPLSDSWELHLRVGVLFADMESSTSITPNSGSAILGGSSSTTFGSESLLWGGGAQFNWGDHWSARLDFQRFESVGDDNGAGEADIDLLSLGILYRL